MGQASEDREGEKKMITRHIKNNYEEKRKRV
jgi:hypothetical protein